MATLPNVKMIPSTDSLHAGEMLNQYRIEKYSGAGAAGVVFRAYDLRLHRKVALKLLGGGMQADPGAWGRLLREARAASRLSHPCLCSIYEVAEERGYTYIAMEYVDGHVLKSLIQPGGLPAREALQYAGQLASALAHVHERGIIHRDVKSSNVIITLSGLAKLVDFGLATRFRHNSRDGNSTCWSSQEYSEDVGGTLTYMAPEILRGERARVQSDLWSLGVLLYEMVASSLPFTGKTSIEIGASILTQSFHPFPRQMPAALVSVIRRCLQKDPAKRYQSATELLADLRKAIAVSTRYFPNGRSEAACQQLGFWVPSPYASGRARTLKHPSVRSGAA